MIVLDTTKPVAIVGFASSSRHETPFDDKDLEIWTMNHAPLSWIPRWDVLFELHTLTHLRQIAAHSTEPTVYLDWLAKQPGPGQEGHQPIYMQDAFSEVPASVKLPREELNAWFKARNATAGYWADDYYTSTVSFMLALAIMQGRPKILMYGVDLLQDEEYSYQRAGCEYLVGFARGMGIPVYIPDTSAICKASYVYGFTEPMESARFEPLIKQIETAIAMGEGQGAKARADASTFGGALQMADLVLGWQEGKRDETKGEKAETDWLTLLKAKRVEMLNRMKQSEAAAQSIQGQSEGFKTAVVWTKHFARGGAFSGDMAVKP